MDDDGPVGAPEWVVTYGDMMSLLLTFFIMLVSLSEIQNDKKYRAVLNALQQYIGYQSAQASPPGKNFPLNSFLQQLDSLGSFSNKSKGTGGVKIKAPEGQNLRVLRTREGATIQVGNSVIFKFGENALTETAKNQLTKIATSLGGKPNKVEIRGHASPSPLPPDAPYKDKIELTYQRARNVLKFLEEQGIQHHRLRITAAADIEPLPRTGDDSSLQFDRVEVYILDALATDYVGPRKMK